MFLLSLYDVYEDERATNERLQHQYDKQLTGYQNCCNFFFFVHLFYTANAVLHFEKNKNQTLKEEEQDKLRSNKKENEAK